MGERYSIDLYFEVERLEQALRATADFTVPNRESTAIVLPSGREVVLPFSRDHNRTTEDEDRIIRTNQLGVCLGAVLQFPVDDEIRSLSGAIGINPEGPTADIGMFDLMIQAVCQYVELSFTAAFSLLSILIKNSPSIHQRFRDLLRDSGGVAGLIDIEEGDQFLWLADPTQVVKIDRTVFLNPDFDPDRGGTDYDVDGFTAALLIECDRLREQVQDQPS